MKRVAVLLAALGCLVLAPAALAYPTSNVLSRVAGNGQFGTTAGVHNQFTFDVAGPATPDAGSSPSGRVELTAATRRGGGVRGPRRAPGGPPGWGGGAPPPQELPGGGGAGFVLRARGGGPGPP